MYRQLRYIIVVATLVFWVLTVNGFSKTPITMWMSSQPAPVHTWAKDFEKAFNEQNPDIELKIEQYPVIDTQRQKLVVAIAGGVAPDIVYDSANVMAQWVDTKVALPLDKFFSSWSAKDDIMPDLLNWLRFEGQLWGIPFSVWSIGDLYNLDVFAGSGVSLPKTWDEMITAAKRLRKVEPDGKVSVIGYNMLLANLDAFVEMQLSMEQLGSTIIDVGDRQAKLNTDTARQALTFLHDVHQAGNPGNIGGTGGAGGIDRMLRGEMAVYHSYYGYNLFSLADRIKSGGNNLEYRRFVGPKSGRDSIQGNGGALFITQASHYPDQAWRVIQAFMERENLKGYLSAHKIALPSRISMHSDRDLRQRPWAIELMSVLRSPLYTYGTRHFYTTSFRIQAGAEFRGAILNQKSVEEALEKAQSIINQIVEEKSGVAGKTQ